MQEAKVLVEFPAGELNRGHEKDAFVVLGPRVLDLAAAVERLGDVALQSMKE
jgi:hypothetical protein